MRSPFTSSHFSDADGNPAGGTTFGNGFTIGWQNGPLGRGESRREPNGAFVEDVLKAVWDRLSYYQQSKFACVENEQAMWHIANALDELDARTRSREARDVEGTHEI